MKTGILYLIRIIFIFMPETRFFFFKSRLLRFSGVSVGDNVRVCSSVHILGNGILSIGSDTWVGAHTLISSSSKVTIGSCVDIGPKVFIGTGTHYIDALGTHVAGAGLNKDVSIEDGVWLGAACLILPGVTVGRQSVVAAGAVVTKNVPPHVIVAGVPAVVIRKLK